MNYINIRKYFPSNKHLYLTKDGLDRLKVKLDRLRQQRFAICSRLLQMDDKEKDEYILANDLIKVLEINEDDTYKIADVLQHAEPMIAKDHPYDVEVGSTVKLQFGDQTIQYMLVDSIEADPSANKISEQSPLGRALLGRKRREVVSVKTPRGDERSYKVLTIG